MMEGVSRVEWKGILDEVVVSLLLQI